MGMMMEEALETGTDGQSDFQLVALVRQGRGAAFAQIMRRNNRRLFRLVRAIVQDDFEAEEVVQRMTYAGIANDQERADLLAYLKAATTDGK